MRKNCNPHISHSSCWVCGSEQLEIVKCSNIKGPLNSKTFSISDSNYGTTGEIYRCVDCGFLQCSSLENVLSFYENLQDDSYETSRPARALQARKILNTVRRYKPKGRLLDIGAGSGILVEQAIKLGYNAEGIEPAKWLVSKAKEHGLPVHLGILPHPEVRHPYDVVALIDVIEHVPNPINLLSNIHNIVAKDGIVVAVAPDIDSLLARIASWKWWHFRVAHIGYFNRKTFEMLFNKAGFRLIGTSRPTWYFTLDYLLERVNTYLPHIMWIPTKSFFRKITIPLNLRDSMLGIFKISQEWQ